MKIKKQQKKLPVNKITISRLDDSEMVTVGGGSLCPPPTIGPLTICPSVDGPCVDTTYITSTKL